jgi:hypothetical protein
VDDYLDQSKTWFKELPSKVCKYLDKLNYPQKNIKGESKINRTKKRR